jgi:hypothetical protein
MDVVTLRFYLVLWMAWNPRVGYEPFANQRQSQRATNKAS